MKGAVIVIWMAAVVNILVGCFFIYDGAENGAVFIAVGAVFLALAAQRTAAAKKGKVDAG